MPNVIIDFLKSLKDKKELWRLDHTEQVKLINGRYKLLFGQNFWIPIKELELSFIIRAKGWIGEHKILDCQGIHNKLNDRLTARITIDSNDFPAKRELHWKDAASAAWAENAPANALVVEQWPEVFDGLGEGKWLLIKSRAVDDDVAGLVRE